MKIFEKKVFKIINRSDYDSQSFSEKSKFTADSEKINVKFYVRKCENRFFETDNIRHYHAENFLKIWFGR